MYKDWLSGPQRPAAIHGAGHGRDIAGKYRLNKSGYINV
jgi:hypothetical protein